MQTTSHSLSSVQSSLFHPTPLLQLIIIIPKSETKLHSSIHTYTIPIPTQSDSKTLMENPMKFESLHSNRYESRIRTHPSSPEFEFWMGRNPSSPQPNILSADELFVDGVLLPLDLVSTKETLVVRENEEGVSYGPELTSLEPPSTVVVTGSRRWKDMFKISSKETKDKNESAKTIKKREGKSGGGVHGGGAASSAELNINIWPFSRSRSAGNGGTRTKVSTTRKVSSAPCSRSNSGGESKTRKWQASPGRAGALSGVPVGRSSPVWQMLRAPTATVRRLATSVKDSESPKIVKAKVLKSCKQGAAAGDGLKRRGSGGSNDGSGVVNLFSLRSLFSKKVY